MSGEESGVYISVLEGEWDALEAENKKLRLAIAGVRKVIHLWIGVHFGKRELEELRRIVSEVNDGLI